VRGKDELARFHRVYLPVFLSAMLADWLQGPFVYALYQGYGIDREHNGYLFVAGFGASAAFGTFVGAAADQCGRRKFALLYCAIYFGHCLTKHLNEFGVLTLGPFSAAFPHRSCSAYLTLGLFRSHSVEVSMASNWATHSRLPTSAAALLLSRLASWVKLLRTSCRSHRLEEACIMEAT